MRIPQSTARVKEVTHRIVDTLCLLDDDEVLGRGLERVCGDRSARISRVQNRMISMQGDEASGLTREGGLSAVKAEFGINSNLMDLARLTSQQQVHLQIREEASTWK